MKFVISVIINIVFAAALVIVLEKLQRQNQRNTTLNEDHRTALYQVENRYKDEIRHWKESYLESSKNDPSFPMPQASHYPMSPEDRAAREKADEFFEKLVAENKKKGHKAKLKE
jgi:hypothetical protein